MAYYMDEILDKKILPLKYFAFSPCFRREAGSHGKDTKGIFRVHEFIKFEQVVLCEASHEASVKFHEELTSNSEALLQELRLPHRVVVNCGGDLGLGQVKKYDIEAWMPSEKRYRETHSSSYFHDFQSRRLNIRYRDDSGTVCYVHSLNNTALALPRILCQLVENNQRPDGSISVPEVLQGPWAKMSSQDMFDLHGRHYGDRSRTNGLRFRRYCGVGKVAARFRRVAARPLFVLKPRLLNKLVAATVRPAKPLSPLAGREAAGPEKPRGMLVSDEGLAPDRLP
jgi:hypothetical protein